MTPPKNEPLIPLDRDDIALLLSKDMTDWHNVKTGEALVRRLRKVANKLVDYAHLHYVAQQPVTAPTSSVLPGLPGSA